MASKKYALLPMEDDLAPAKVVKSKLKSKDKSRHHDKSSHGDKKRSRSPRPDPEHRGKAIRRSNKDEDSWADEEYASAEEPEFEHSPAKRLKHSVEDNKEDEEDEEEREKQRDRAERDAFSQRMIAKSKKPELVEDRSKARRSMADSALPDLREKSRQDYLAKREIERLALLRLQVQEEQQELQRGDVQLSKAEIRQFAKNKELLEITDARRSIPDHVDGYAIPDAQRKDEVLKQRNVERNELGQEVFSSEHDVWEKEQLSKQASQIKSRERVNEGDYDYLLDEEQQIRFLLDHKQEGNIEDKLLAQNIKAAEAKELSIQESRKLLPIYQYRQQFIDACLQNQVLVLVGDTGSGKTTQATQYLVEAGFAKSGMIGCTQPRRVAAMSVAARVSDEMGCKLGSEVGYSVRFENLTGPKTVIKYLTDGMLLRELMGGAIGEYAAVLIDEAHERTVASDILMTLLADEVRARPDFRLIISSATLNAVKFSEYFDNAPIFSVPGRRFPVDIYYTAQPEANYLAAAISTTMQIHASQPLEGDILVFLAGQDEIEACMEALSEISRKLKGRIAELVLCPIYANLPSELQAQIFVPAPKGSRKVVIATNIAETSITIDTVKFVIDAGFMKEMVFSPATGMSKLVAVPISRASANQRSGRAGRTSHGMAFRLFPRWIYNELDESQTPEIQRTNLDGVVLLLKAIGIDDLLEFDFLDKPSTESIIASLNKLYAIGALNSAGELTKRGRQLSELPIDVMLGVSILSSEKYGCTEEVLTVCAMLSEASTLFFRPKNQKTQSDVARSRFTSKEGGDFLTLLNIWNEWVDNDFSSIWAKQNYLQERSLRRARDIRDQLSKLTERVEIPPSSCGADTVPVMKAITSGFFCNASLLNSDKQSYRTLKSQNSSIYIHPSSVLMDENSTLPRMIVYSELVETSRQYMRSCMEIQPAWLGEIAPHYYKKKELEGLESRKMPKDPSRM